MKFTIRVQEHNFVVEVGDVHQRPIVAVVEGERFEVWPDSEALTRPAIETPSQPLPKAPPPPEANGNLVRAPIPGVIVSIAVQPGASVSVGQELCVLEAMKMKNAIRATHAGKIAAVLVSPGQTVKQREGLIEYSA